MDNHQQTVIKQLGEQAMANKHLVINRLLELVCDVKPDLHVNYHPAQTN